MDTPQAEETPESLNEQVHFD